MSTTGPGDNQGWGQQPGQPSGDPSWQGGQPPPPPPGQWGGQPQPPYPGQGGYSQPIPNYLVWAILTTLFCCLPAGIVSIVFSAQVNTKQQAGDIAGALDSSKKAKMWAIIAAVAGAVIAILYIIFIVAFGASVGFSTYGL